MLKPASLFTDGAVLCRRKEIRVFGEAADGDEVCVRLTAADGRLLAEGCARAAGGRFEACMAPQEAQDGCTLEIRAGGEHATARDIAIGEVFLAGGQSNMELALANADGGPERIREHRDPLLRFFNVPKMARVCPEQQEAVDAARWEAVSPGRGGENSAVAYFFACRLRAAEPELPVGMIDCYWGGTSITCWLEESVLETSEEGRRYLKEYAEKTGGITLETYLKEEKTFFETLDAWNRQVDRFKQSHPGADWNAVTEACGLCPWNPPAGPGSPYRPAGLAEPMVHAAAPATLTGILWYQGEEDADKTDRYDELMILLIRRWRELFRDPELPFLFVQLPMWVDFGKEDTFRWPALRLQQAAVRDAVPGTGMVCLIDQGEYGNIHPTNKKPVGDRLYELAAEMLYGGGEISPRATGVRMEGDTALVALSAPVETRDGQAPRLLEIAGEDGAFRPAEGWPEDGCLKIRNPEIRRPALVRYAWTDYSDQVNLFGKNGLPLEPFRLETKEKRRDG